DGKVARLYDARRTPHMFVIDKEGILRYHGAIDDNRLAGKPADEVTNFVVNAVHQLAEEETVTPDYVKPYGCSIKYKP
ncbi:MAG: thioredoxin family protein, partial [Planctomycetota bacterium]|nr:thioredoxin family protein [Planctomycetota bacterium]